MQLDVFRLLLEAEGVVNDNKKRERGERGGENEEESELDVQEKFVVGITLSAGLLISDLLFD